MLQKHDQAQGSPLKPVQPEIEIPRPIGPQSLTII